MVVECADTHELDGGACVAYSPRGDGAHITQRVPSGKREGNRHSAFEPTAMPFHRLAKYSPTLLRIGTEPRGDLVSSVVDAGATLSCACPT